MKEEHYCISKARFAWRDAHSITGLGVGQLNALLSHSGIPRSLSREGTTRSLSRKGTTPSLSRKGTTRSLSR